VYLGTKTTVQNICFLIALIFISSVPALNDFQISGHSVIFDLTRIENIKDGLLAGKFPVRLNYLSAGGAGNATPSCYGELFLYIPAFLEIFGAPPLYAYKFFWLILNTACVLISYFCVTSITKSKHIGLMFSAIYTLCIYRLLDIYLRAANGEALAMVFLPLVMLGVYKIIHCDKKRWYLFALGMTGILQSHIISLFLTTVFVLLYAAFHFKCMTKACFVAAFKAAVFTICLNMWFIIPFLSFYPALVSAPGGNKELLYNTAVYPSQFFAAFVQNSGGDKMARGSTDGEMPLTLGPLSAVGGIVFIVLLFMASCWRNTTIKRNGLLSMGKTPFFLGAVAVFAASVFFPWLQLINRIPPMKIFAQIQFAWRFLIIAAPLLCFTAAIAGYIFLRQTQLNKSDIAFVTLLVSVMGSMYYLGTFLNAGVVLENTNSKYKYWPGSDYTYKGSGQEQTNERSNIVTASEGITPVRFEREHHKMSVTFIKKADTSGWLEIPVYNFPGYRAAIDGDAGLQIEHGENNFVRIHIPVTLPPKSVNSMTHVVSLYYREPPLFWLGNLISLCTILGVIVYCMRKILFSRLWSRFAYKRIWLLINKIE
jgi:uncharacterized membrane protein YfhO